MQRRSTDGMTRVKRYGSFVFGIGFAGAVALATACVVHEHCDGFFVTECHTVCDYFCDPFGCFPSCYDECFDVCVVAPPPPPPPATPVSPPAPPADGGARPGVLCTPCTVDSDCGSGGLCIVVGGGDASMGTTGFCGVPCNTANDCPQNFLCTQIGSSRQCVPTTTTGCR